MALEDRDANDQAAPRPVLAILWTGIIAILSIAAGLLLFHR